MIEDIHIRPHRRRRATSYERYVWLYLFTGILLGVLSARFVGIDKLDFIDSLFPEAVGILFTVLVLERLNEQRSTRNCKEQLIRQMRNPNHHLALMAVQELRAKGWLTDGSLRGAYLDRTNLQGGSLRDSDLRGASLRGANLRDIHPYGANFSAADLTGADLLRADLSRTRLEGARLPDGTMWTPNVDLARFTDEAHPDRWRPMPDPVFELPA